MTYPHYYPREFPIVISVARLFYDDHIARGHGASDQVTKRTTHITTIRLEKDGWDDLLLGSRCFGFCEPDCDGIDGPKTRSLAASARSVYNKMLKTAELTHRLM